MPQFNVSRSIFIDAPAEKVYSALNDFNQWVKWSPWLIMDPKAKVDIASDAKSYEWEGPRTGSGNMQIVRENDGKSVFYDLNFIKPWKSSASVDIQLNGKGEGTEVTWNMESSLPWFLFWMKNNMVAFIGNDYERGLNLLKDLVEDGQVHSQLNFIGEKEFSGFKYVGIRRSGSLDSATDQMGKDITMLLPYGDMKDIFVQYHKWDFVKKIASYTAGIAVQDIPSNLPSEFIKGSIPSSTVYCLEHKGPYRHLGNAWTTMYNMQRSKEFKIRKDIHPFETYLNNPGTTDPKDLLTHVNFAIK